MRGGGTALLATRFALLLLPGALGAQPVERSEVQVLRAEIDRLQGQVADLVRRLEAREKQEHPRETGESSQAQSESRRMAEQNGAGLRTVRLRGLLNVDARAFVGDDAQGESDSLLLRRARIIADGEIGRNTRFQFTTEFGGSSVSMLDANVTVAFTEALELKAGKFKTPIGLEVLQGAGATSFAERSLASTLLPNRDVGVQLGGALAGRRMDYAVGVFNGAPGGSHGGNSDVDDHRQVAGRVMVRPFADGVGQGLSLGVGGSAGRHESAAARASGYRSEASRTIFAYLPGVTADGTVSRLVPQFDFRHGSLGVMGEYVTVRLDLKPSAAARRETLRHEAWQITGGYVLTGEKSTYGQLVPRTEFDPLSGTWGAVEVLARYAELNLDDAANPAFAAPAASVTKAETLTLGLKWYWSRATMLSLNYVDGRFGFDRSAPFVMPVGLLRTDERVVVSRFQLAF